MGNKASRAADANVNRLKQEYLTKKLREAAPKSPISQERGLHFIPQKIFVDQGTQTQKSSLSSKDSYIKKLGLSRRTLLVAFAVYLLSCLLFAISEPLQACMVYLHPPKWPLGNLQDLHYVHLQNARNIVFHTEDGLDIHGYHVFPHRMSPNSSQHDAELATAERIMLYLHGNGASRAYRFRIQVVKDLAVLCGAHVLAIDYRGFGDSGGWPSERGTLLDTQAVMHFVDNAVTQHGRAGKSRPRVYIYGQSLGAGIGVAMAHDARTHNRRYLPLLSGLILDAPFSSLKEAALTHPTTLLFRIFPPMQNFM
ncbi:MAG: alpha/beta fold hydrolase [Hymenobacter sp.]|nr:MAG: alpha/beta fold hydrolase [Hymenobacter sp.]